MRPPACSAFLLAGLLLAGCSSSNGPDAARRPPSPAASAAAERVTATLSGTRLSLEVADEPAERERGLMGRTSVPAGTGMVFLFDQLSTARFYMYDVPIPLRATFVREGRVVLSVVMPPCTERVPSACPTYGPDEPYDTVVETDPDVAPQPRPGDALVPERPGS